MSPGTVGRELWRQLPRRLRSFVYRTSNWTGLPFVISYAAGYGERHALRHFAGVVPALRDAYANAHGAERERLARQFDGILRGLVLPNGVSKATYAKRQNIVLEGVLADPACGLGTGALRVLDVPASSGIASLDSFRLLNRFYQVRRYVLGDLSFQVLYDPDRECVFDEAGRLLQVRRGDRFFSMHRVHAHGSDVSALTRLLLLPLTARARDLERRYRFDDARTLVPISLVHPEVETILGNGVAGVERVDVFERVPGTYDLILCFNLLQRNYFPPEWIARGTANLAAALCEGGLLITGSPDANGSSGYRVARKQGGALVTVKQEGRP